jgi:hypothetical protein
MSEKKAETTYHYETDYLKDDALSELKEPLSKALELDEADFNRLSPEVKNLLSGRRRIGVTWLDDYEVVAEIIDDEGCGCGVKIGQKAVFDLRHRLKPELSDMVCCMNILTPVLAIFYMSFDRASEGLNPVTRVWTHYDCLQTNDALAQNKARLRVYLRDAKTHEVVTKPVLDQKGAEAHG